MLRHATALAFFLIALTLLTASPSAQNLALPMPAAPATASPYGVPIKRVNNYDTAPVTFEGQRLFTIAAAPPPLDSVEVPLVVQRVYTIQANLRQIAPAAISSRSARFDSKTFTIVIGDENGSPTLYATDGTKHDKAPIMTITAPDASFNGEPKEELAIQWRAILQSALGRAVLASEPDYMRAQLRKLPLVLLGGAIATLLIVWARRRLRATGKTIEAGGRRTFIAGLLWVLGVAVLAMWALIGYWLLTIFPFTRTFANQLSGRFVQLATLWIVIAVLNRAIGLAIARAAESWRSNLLLTAEQRARMKLRSPTLVRSAENLKSILVWTIAIVWTFSILAISTVSILTIGAVVAFAFSFATQSLIKDYLNGFLILAEDQFAIGDTVTIGGVSGTVEDLTLRITRIRTDEGRLVTIPNSTIMAVENATRSWARVDYRVSIAGSSDVERATAVLQNVLDGLTTDPRWIKAILEPPQVLGVDAVSYAGVVLRAWIKTVPSERAALSREINQRVGDAFRRNGIAIGASQSALIMQASPAPPEQRRPPV